MPYGVGYATRAREKSHTFPVYKNPEQALGARQSPGQIVVVVDGKRVAVRVRVPDREAEVCPQVVPLRQQLPEVLVAHGLITIHGESDDVGIELQNNSKLCAIPARVRRAVTIDGAARTPTLLFTATMPLSTLSCFLDILGAAFTQRRITADSTGRETCIPNRDGVRPCTSAAPTADS